MIPATLSATDVFSSANNRRRGMTLVELMVVLAIIVIMASLAVGVFVNIKSGNDTIARHNELRDVLNQARTAAIYGHGSSKVVMDTRAGTVTAYAIYPVGMWSMETIDGGVVKGAQGIDGTAIGILQMPGKYGKAAEFGQMGSASYITLPSAPYEMNDGIRLEAWVNVYGDSDIAAFGGTQTIIEKAGAYYLRINAMGTVEAGTLNKGIASTARLAANTWFKITAQLDRHEYVIYINDALVGRIQLTAADLADPQERRGPLGDCSYGQVVTIGARGGGFKGLIDEVRIGSVVKEREFTLQSGLAEERLDHNTWPLNAVYYAPDGTLDSRFHLAQVRLSYEREGFEYFVAVGRLGVVEQMGSSEVVMDPNAPNAGAGGGTPQAPAVNPGNSGQASVGKGKKP